MQQHSSKVTQIPTKQMVDVTIGGNIRRYRNARLLTAEGLGAMLDPVMSDGGITKMERGETRIYAGHLFQISRALRVSVASLMAGIEEEQLGEGAGAQPLSRDELRMLRQMAELKNAPVEEQAEYVLKCFTTMAQMLGEHMKAKGV